jgi:hypothetical protein
MGRGKGKAGRKEPTLAVRKLNREPKISGTPNSAPQTVGTTKPPREKKSAGNTNVPDPSAFPTPMGRTKPFTKQHAKWPALFKKNIGVIESHIKSLDRIMQSMKADMVDMPEEERLEWELGERGNWRVICGMMDRAREVLATTREAAIGIVSIPDGACFHPLTMGSVATN